jgi:hypothetical protein
MSRSMRFPLGGVLLSLAIGACGADDDDSDPGAMEVSSSDESTAAKDLCPEDVPPELAPPPDQQLSFALPAAGVQKYTCAETEDGFAWSFVAPEADLFESERQVGTHYAGPTWEYEDGSTVVGAVEASAEIDPTAVPWLLLDATSNDGASGKMTPVTWIQRLSTSEGLAPTTGCDADNLGATADVPYAADYFFYRTMTEDDAGNVRCGE